MLVNYIMKTVLQYAFSNMIPDNWQDADKNNNALFLNKVVDYAKAQVQRLGFRIVTGKWLHIFYIYITHVYYIIHFVNQKYLHLKAKF